MSSTPSLRIIVADDEPVIRMGLEALLVSLGHTVIGQAANGREALELTRMLKPDLLLLDIRMPELDGLTVAEILAAELPLPVVILSAFSDSALMERAYHASVMGYLVKPVVKEKLAPMIERAPSRFAAMQAAARQVYTLHEQLETREMIDAARKILAASGMAQEKALLVMQETAQQRNQSMREVAETIISLGR